MRASRSKQNRKLPPPPCTYTIRSGDTLGSIAARHLGASKRWPEIARANPGLNPDRLRVGAVINLPCANVAGQGGSAPKAKPGAPLAGTGFLARLSGQKTPAVPGAGKKKGGASPSAQKKIKGGASSSRPAAAAQSATKKTGSGPSSGTGEKKAALPAVPAKPAPPPLPVWTAKAGEDFAGVLQRWAKAAKYRVVLGTTDAWTLAVPVSIRGDFETAVNQLVRGLGSDGKAPPVRIYSNRVVRLGGL